MTNKALPGGLAHGLAILMTLLLTIVLAAGCLLWQFAGLISDRSLHESIALTPSVVDAQMERIQSIVEDLAERYSFQPETVMDIVTRESVEDYAREVIAWWMGLTGDEPSIVAPAYDASAVEAAVREDELFLESTPSAQRRTIARDCVAYTVSQEITKAVLPIRTVLLTLALPSVLEKIDIPHYVQLAALAPKVCAIAAAVLLVLIALTMIRRISKAAMYIGAALAASTLVMLGVGAMVWSMGIGPMIKEVSSLLAMQLDLLGGHLVLQTGVSAIVFLGVGVALMALHQHDMHRLMQSKRGVEA